MAKKKNQEVKQIELPENLVRTNHEFLFIYDAKLCNPNGDPDNENKPRMDEEREINLVSDVRLKRYIRDYLQQYKEKKIYVTKLDDKPVLPKDILDDLKNRKTNLKFKDDTNLTEFYLRNLIDVRMFGATMAIADAQNTFTGPIQINWGYSLNPVSLCDSKGITTHFKSGAKVTQSSMGTDYRVNYSLIAFYGNIIAKKCEHTLLTEDDIKLFDEAIIKSIPLMATRSKIGQYPRLYIRLEYNSNEYLFGDFRKLIKFNTKSEKIKRENVRDINEVELDITELVNQIELIKNTKINKNNKDVSLLKNLVYWQSEDLYLKGGKIKYENE